MRISWRVLLLAAVSGLFGACARPRSVSSTAGLQPGDQADFSFAGLAGEAVTARRLRGRVTLLLFATTFDLGSQAQAKQLQDFYRLHAPRVNAVLIVLEPPHAVELARTFKEVLGLSYEVAMADQATLDGQGPFGEVKTVPTWIVFDRQGQRSATVTGLLAPKKLTSLVEAVE